ncbi:threonine--tRNA ligase, partial [Streptomyces tricolor]
ASGSWEAAQSAYVLDRGHRSRLITPDQGTRGARIRAARRVPYQAVVGAREAGAGLAAVRLRDGRRPGALPVPDLLSRIAERVAARGTALWD